ncbi:Carboxylesterase 1 [Camellia lanceoleosa]|uniref:Carboxylesterase 1 n=1 Tax=Camellia lanceoleosa TaxID=1840588 RepID=A0ACC0H0M0_9ERIC|nr:Carboxylesterase 1 [Camellia lanceoleosa]
MSNEEATTTTPPSSTDSMNDKLSRYIPISLNPDGSINRFPEIPTTPASPDPNSPSPVLSKDIPLNPSHNTWLRLFLPRQSLHRSAAAKPPLIVYVHGGAFIICSAASTTFHNFCSEMAAHLGAVVASVEYRLAPEHRLPAAYDDTMDALYWIRASKDEWLRDFADITNCFLLGTSAGGNIVYHAGLRAAAEADDLSPLNIRGLVLHHPAFGGSERTGSELRLADDRILPEFVLDLGWKLSLPVGADRDHEYCNPTVGSESGALEKMKLLGWKVMVTGCDGDPMIDRQMEFVKILEKKGVKVVGQFDEGGYHGLEIMDPTKTTPLFDSVKQFTTISH